MIVMIVDGAMPIRSVRVYVPGRLNAAVAAFAPGLPGTWLLGMGMMGGLFVVLIRAHCVYAAVPDVFTNAGMALKPLDDLCIHAPV
ncbi:hypothetical protein ACCD04_22215 [Telluria sp. Tellsp131]